MAGQRELSEHQILLHSDPAGLHLSPSGKCLSRNGWPWTAKMTDILLHPEVYVHIFQHPQAGHVWYHLGGADIFDHPELLTDALYHCEAWAGILHYREAWFDALYFP